MAAKGDIQVGKDTDGVSLLAVGTDFTALVADSSQTNGVTWSRPSGGVAVLELEDEFMGGTSESGEIGNCNWTLGGSFINPAPTTDHPGVIGLRSGNTTGAVSEIHLGLSTTSGVITAVQVDRFMAILLTGTASNVQYRVGLLQSAGSTDGGTDGVFFEYDSATNANWTTKTRASSSTTTNTTSVAVTANNWYQFEARRQSGGNWDFYINGSLVFTHSTNLPTAVLVPTFAVETLENATKDMHVDYFRLRSVTLGQRWT